DVIIGAYTYSNGQTEEGKAFVYHGSSDGLDATPAWTIEGNQSNAHLGHSVGTAGDVNGDGYADVLISAPTHSNGQTEEGRVSVYYGSENGLNATPAWTAESDQAYAQFGVSAGTAGDVNGDGYADIIAGAHWYDNGEQDEGRAFVYYGSVSGLSAMADWTTESNQADARMGIAVSTAGDVNGDGYADVIVGAHQYDNGQEDEGKAWVYSGSASGLNATANWEAKGDQEGANLGRTVGTAGDVNGDGYADVIVGAPYYDNGQTDEGCVFVYYGAPDNLSALANWTAEGNQTGAQLGYQAGTAGDVNGDGYADVIIGAPYYDNGQTDEGRVYVYLGSSDGLGTTADWFAESDQDNAKFGHSAGTAGDVNGDGYADVIIGAIYYDNGNTDEGRAFVYYGSSTGLGDTPGWVVENNQAGSAFGYSTGTAGDVNGDGYDDVIIGADRYDNGQTDEGRGYVYQGSATGLSTTANWTVDGDQSGARLGLSSGTAGDINNDGYADIIIGAPYYDHGQTDEGMALVYYGSPSGLYASASWTAEGNQPDARFGSRVGTAGDVNGDGYADVIVTAVRYDHGQTDEGMAFVYHGSTAGLNATADWTAESDQSDARLASWVGTAGDVNGDGYADIIMVAYHYTGDFVYEGNAFLHYGSVNGLNAMADWSVQGGQADAALRVAATAGDVNGDGYADVIIGIPGYDTVHENAGRAVLYYGNGSNGLSLLPRQMRSDGITPIAPLGLSDTTTGVQLHLIARMPLGREKVKLEWQVAPLGTPFGSTSGDIVTGTSEEWIDALPGGSLIAQDVTGLTMGTAYHWRVRLLYRPGNRLGQAASRWIHMPWNGWNETDFRTKDCSLGVTLDRMPGGDVFTGDTVRFAATITGTAPVTYTWTMNGETLAQSGSAFEHRFDAAGIYTISVAADNGCAQASDTTVVQVQQAFSPYPDLSLSYKSVNLASVEAGDVLTYTIVIQNSGQTTATATLTDPLPAHTTYLAGSAQASNGDPATWEQDALHWSGPVLSGTPTIVQFAVVVQDARVGTEITNVATLDDGRGTTTTLQTSSISNPGYRFTINDGALYTRIPTVSLSFSWDAAIDITTFKVSNDGGFTQAGDTTGWIAIDPADPSYDDWILTTYGNLRLPRTVYIKFRDSDGHQYGPIQDDIIYDPVPPQVTDIEVTGNAGQGGDQVMIQVAASDDNSGVDSVQVSASVEFDSFFTFQAGGAVTGISWPVQSDELYVRVTDRAGNVSTANSVPRPVQSEFIIYLPIVIR
ncbi:MAG: FG-GAP repeat protein, partial [Anaerolineae bacterium]|nr:FG-GAP repeat protein [Anaerolineae bacterium]